jgi:metallo-beta-lactamase class B
MKPGIYYLILTLFFAYLPVNSFSRELDRNFWDEDIEYIPVNTHTYILVSYANLDGIGRIGTNHLLYIKNKKAFLFDTPNDNYLAGKLYRFVKDSLKAEISVISVSHWHQDHSGGIDTLNKLGAKSFSYYKTRESMQRVGLIPVLNTFNDSITIDFEGTTILLAFYGAGHTADNSVGWIESEKILFSGSVIRSMDNTNLGYLKDADVKAWPQTVENISNRFDNAILIIPGHGEAGGYELIGHTEKIVNQANLQ